tara:strand:- start:4324 stop:4701 length:378 start_codon:yes stop_codon:yes gene_type:complete
MDSIIETFNRQMFETYTEMFPDIEPSIINDLINNHNDQDCIEEYLIELNNSINKTDKERKVELESNLGLEIVSELKFSSVGTSHDTNLVETKTPKTSSGWNKIKKIVTRRSNSYSNNEIKFQKFD